MSQTASKNFGHFLRFSLGASLHFLLCMCLLLLLMVLLSRRSLLCLYNCLTFRLFVGLSCLKNQDDSCIDATKRLTPSTTIVSSSSFLNTEWETEWERRKRQKLTGNCKLWMDCDQLWNFIIPIQILNRIGHIGKNNNFIGAYCLNVRNWVSQNRKYVDIHIEGHSRGC